MGIPSCEKGIRTSHFAWTEVTSLNISSTGVVEVASYEQQCINSLGLWVWREETEEGEGGNCYSM